MCQRPSQHVRFDSRATIQGAPLKLQANAAVTMAMALHELCTNAIKYGALSQPGGHVEVTWSLDPGAARPFHFQWRERGGPLVTPPTDTGFGTSMIKRALASALQAKVQLVYAPEGLVCSVDAPSTVLVTRGRTLTAYSVRNGRTPTPPVMSAMGRKQR